ncbi:MAG: SDR family NAD(P)-dependent oxidoreductase [Ectothiorhodospiraceae bacterium]|nr:SDR family NAD(P)-dependent oxidoreductase [Ectothiorhodospiraceae bacterium]
MRGAWITGASSGIGAALARGLVERGWRVAASARSVERLQALASECPGVDPRPLDVTDAEAVARTVAALRDDPGLPDLAILNAGDYTPMPAREFDVALCRHLVDVNYMGVVHCIGALLPAMLARGHGRIMITASVAAYRGLPLAAPYGATKAALVNLAESLRCELHGSGVEIQIVNPGFVRTPLTAKNRFTMPFLLEPEDAAATILARLEHRGFEIAFPRRLVAVLKLLRSLPYALYFPLVRFGTGSR